MLRFTEKFCPPLLNRSQQSPECTWLIHFCHCSLVKKKKQKQNNPLCLLPGKRCDRRKCACCVKSFQISLSVSFDLSLLLIFSHAKSRGSGRACSAQVLSLCFQFDARYIYIYKVSVLYIYKCIKPKTQWHWTCHRYTYNMLFFLLHQVYVHDCTMVSPYPLLFFGGKISILTVTVPALLGRAVCVTQTLFKQISSRSCRHSSRRSRNCN